MKSYDIVGWGKPRRPLEDAEQSLRDLADGKVVGRIVLEMKGES